VTRRICDAATTDGKGREWIEQTGTAQRRHDAEPETSLGKRFGVQLMSILPIERLR